MNDSVTLRGHHWICLHFFRGEGYTGEFVENLESVIARLAGEDALVVEGPDAVCAACCHLVDGLCTSESSGEQVIRRIDDLAVELLGLTPGETRPFRPSRALTAALPVWREKACRGCTWEELCVPQFQIGLTSSPRRPS